jgi:hypothetical protein
MSKNEIRERERRWAVPVFIACLLSVLLFIAAIFIPQSADLPSDPTVAEQLEAFDANREILIAGRILQAVAIGLLAAPLLYLFRAAQARSDAVRRGLIGIVVIGPLFFAVGGIVGTLALDSIAADFTLAETPCAEDEGEAQDDCLEEEVIRSDSTFSVAGGISLAGSLGLLVGMVYTCLQAMRVGLLTRFLGSLGMALGVAVLLFGPIGPPAIVMYCLSLGLLFINRWPGGRPPAWEAVEAIPWPRPGEQPVEPEPESQPEDIEGSAEEILGTDQPPGNDGDSSSSGPERRKRKRR